MDGENILFATGYLVLKSNKKLEREEKCGFERFINKGMKVEFITI